MLRDQIFGAPPRSERVDVPEWGLAVWVRAMDGLARLRWEQRAAALRQTHSEAHALAALLVAVVCDEAGAPAFAEEDVDRVAALDAAALLRVYEAAARLNGLREEDREAARKNCSAAPGG